MGDWNIIRYDTSKRNVWDDFVRHARNGTFLFERAYMEYHSDRFHDSSLMAYRKGKLRALLPADITPDKWLHSHRGLTYGGWVTPLNHFDANDMLELWESWMSWCRQEGIVGIDYKPLPWIYACYPAQEDLYALFRNGAGLRESNLSSTILLQDPRPFNTQQQRNLRKALSMESEYVSEVDPKEFHRLLTQCLAERHQVSPVHTCAELQLLKSRFPENIHLYGIRSDVGLQAGVCIYLIGKVAHCQYIASTIEGRTCGLLTLLFDILIKSYQQAGYLYFDFGTSNEDHGLILNQGLLRQKAALGGGGVIYNRFSIELS